jgi:hypothetical protein
MVNWICNVVTPIAHHGKSFSANRAKWLFVFNSNFLRMNEAHRSAPNAAQRFEHPHPQRSRASIERAKVVQRDAASEFVN